MEKLWQLYDEQGQVLEGKGDTKGNVFNKGILHAASHVWIWRKNNNITEILLQKRAATKQTWPNHYDVSAAGHINLGETPLTAALREAREEIGLDIDAQNLNLFCVHRAHLKAENGAIENEFQWLYSLELVDDKNFTLETSEVDSLLWSPIDQFENDCTSEQYVPHTKNYYDTVIIAIKSASSLFNK